MINTTKQLLSISLLLLFGCSTSIQVGSKNIDPDKERDRLKLGVINTPGASQNHEPYNATEVEGLKRWLTRVYSTLLQRSISQGELERWVQSVQTTIEAKIQVDWMPIDYRIQDHRNFL